MSEKSKQERIKQLASQINETLDILRDDDNNDERGKGDPVTEEKLTRQVEKFFEENGIDVNALKANKGKPTRVKTGFEPDDDDDDNGEEDPRVKVMNNAEQRDFAKAAQAKMQKDSRELERYHSPQVTEKLKRFQQLQDDVYIVGQILFHQARKEGNARSIHDTYRRMGLFKEMNRRLNADEDLRKALTIAGSGTGAEWIPTGFSNQLWEKIRLQLRIAELFGQINMPTSPFTLPVQAGAATGYLIAEASSTDDSDKITASTPGTGNWTFNAKKIAGRVLVSEEATEDMIIDVLNFIERELTVSIAEAVESAILNGDESVTHQDSDTTAATDADKAWEGLRYFALNNAGTATLDLSNAAPALDDVRDLRKLMGNAGINPMRLALITGLAGYIQFLKIAEVLTLDKYGPQATVLTGELARIDGIPIIVSEFQREDLNASGVYDGVTTNRGGFLLVNRDGFYRGLRRGVTVQTMTDIETDVTAVVGKQRIDFEDVYDATLAANRHAVFGYNMAV